MRRWKKLFCNTERTKTLFCLKEKIKNICVEKNNSHTKLIKLNHLCSGVYPCLVLGNVIPPPYWRPSFFFFGWGKCFLFLSVPVYNVEKSLQISSSWIPPSPLKNDMLQANKKDKKSIKETNVVQQIQSLLYLASLLYPFSGSCESRRDKKKGGGDILMQIVGTKI